MLGTMPTPPNTRAVVFAALPGSAQLRIFQLLCDSCPPDTPGTCWLAPVCKQWRDLACSVKGLRVFFYSDQQQQQVDSFCAWLRRHAPQVVALGITQPGTSAVEALAALAQAATAAAAAGKPLPLTRLVITEAFLLEQEVCRDVLPPLLAALPHLEHLGLTLEGRLSHDQEAASQAAVAALGPLQHSTSLTSLVLKGPCYEEQGAADAYAQLLSVLPRTLRNLVWSIPDMEDTCGLSLTHLTALTRLSLSRVYDPAQERARADLQADTFTSLRQLELWGAQVSDQTLVAHKEQLVVLELRNVSPVLQQLTHLQCLLLEQSAPVQELLQAAPPLKELRVALGAGSPWSTPWALQHYKGLTGLERLVLEKRGTPQAAPLGLYTLTQLKQLRLRFDPRTAEAAVQVSWAGALAGLVNLEQLTVPGALIDCCHPWLTGLTRLVVLHVNRTWGIRDRPVAVAHISQLLVPRLGCSDSSSSSPAAGMQAAAGQVRVVCLPPEWRWQPEPPGAVPQLHAAVLAAVPVLPPNMHVFRGTWWQLKQCGMALWPAPVAACLQQLFM